MNGQGIVEESGKQYVPPITWTLKVVARHFELGQFDLLGRKKNTKVVTARHTAMYLLWNLQSYTLREIGEALGRRTPATVSHGYKVIADRLPADESLQERINSIKEELLI
jgi:chromosomal replication initiation ATPase DnaA